MTAEVVILKPRRRLHVPQRLRDISPAYRIATDAYQAAAQHLDPQDHPELFDTLWTLVEREAAKAERLLNGVRQ